MKYFNAIVDNLLFDILVYSPFNALSLLILNSIFIILNLYAVIS